MIDINLIRTDPTAVAAALEKRGCKADLDEIIKLDETRREIIGRTENAQSRKEQSERGHTAA